MLKDKIKTFSVIHLPQNNREDVVKRLGIILSKSHLQCIAMPDYYIVVNIAKDECKRFCEYLGIKRYSNWSYGSIGDEACEQYAEVLRTHSDELYDILDEDAMIEAFKANKTFLYRSLSRHQAYTRYLSTVKA